jgi:hypothetical protein
MTRSRPTRDYTYPEEWWWALLRMAGQFIQEQHEGRQPLGWAILGICEAFAPSEEWWLVVRSGQRRILRQASVRVSRPQNPPDAGTTEGNKDTVRIDRDAWEAFHDLSHLSLPEHLADRRSGRRRRREPAGEFLKWWARYGV